MAAAGDGDIASAQDKKHGFGSEGDLASGMDQKKADQAQIKEDRRAGGGDSGGGGVDVQAALGGRGKGFVDGGNEGPDSQGGSMQSSHANV